MSSGSLGAHEGWTHPGQTAADPGSTQGRFAALAPLPSAQTLGVGTHWHTLPAPISVGKDYSNRAGKGGSLDVQLCEHKGGSPVGLGKGEAQGK